jgi:D-xylose transport system ATP-binding protein
MPSSMQPLVVAGATVVISHNLENVFRVADRISVIHLGRNVATFDRRATAREDGVAAITGALPERAVAA